MLSIRPILALMAFVLLSNLSQGQEKPRLAPLLALQEALEDAVADNEGSIACILVSRSTDYDQWQAGPPAPAEGKLGRFHGKTQLGTIADDKQARERLNALWLDSPDHSPESFGSGIVIDARGLVLTNAHVVRNATKIFVRLPKNKGSYADIYASDPRSDLAVLKLLDVPEGLKPVSFGLGEKIRKGQLVLLLANPFAAGFRDGSPSASWGMISNLRRRMPGARTEFDRESQTLHHHGTLLQVDTQMNLGSSGGACSTSRAN